MARGERVLPSGVVTQVITRYIPVRRTGLEALVHLKLIDGHSSHDGNSKTYYIDIDSLMSVIRADVSDAIYVGIHKSLEDELREVQ